MTLRVRRGDAEAPIEPLRGKRVAVIGYGNQGRAHALNLRDSGIEIVVGARAGGAGVRCSTEAGFKVTEPREAAATADLIILAVPDEVHADVYRQLEPALRSGAIVGLIHGFSIRYGLIKPRSDLGVVLVAPKGPGATLRDRYVEGRGIPCLFALHQNTPRGDAESIALAWASGIGCARAAIIDTTFADEAETDLFGEQAVLCGGVLGLVRAAFETLVAAGYPEELAYLECVHELKQVTDLLYARGPTGMCEAISNTAEFGAYVAAPQVVDDHVRTRLSQLLDAIRDGRFAAEFRTDATNGFSWFNQQRKALAAHSMNEAGRTVRGFMPWLDAP